ncbi:hypothetical protein, partial [Archangium sp.]|uniref:hypothetical protein n=1 Tax=Archangium sp. TaxID=1872627 RepID=UPI002EDAEC19
MNRKTDATLLKQLAMGTEQGTVNDRAKTAKEDVLTTRQGHPVSNNQSTRTVGRRGPTTLENY